MGDTAEPEHGDQQPVNTLHEAKPVEDIPTSEPEETEEKQSSSTPDKDESNVETVFKNLDIASDKSLPMESHGDQKLEEPTPVKPSVEIPPLEFEIRDNTPIFKSDKLASDIFSLKEPNAHHINNIFSVDGAPSGRMIKRKDLASSIFPVGCMGCKENASDNQMSPRRFIDAKEASECRAGYIDNTPRKRPMSSKPRNPITGGGIELDDNRRSNNRKKDGNPVTGTGYADIVPAVSNTRIPPGGHSKGLW